MAPQLKKKVKILLEDVEKIISERDALLNNDIKNLDEFKRTNSDYIQLENNAISEYKKVLFIGNSTLTDTEYIINFLLSFIKNVPSEGYEMLKRYRDAVRFIHKESDKNNYINIISNITKSNIVSPLERLICADSIYNHGYFDGENGCYSVFSILSEDSQYPIYFRIESCKYLYISDDENFKSNAQDILISFIDTESSNTDSELDYTNIDKPLSSKMKYDKIILPYMGKKGVKSFLNTFLPTFGDETFIYGLQSAFFYNTTNTIRDRILCSNYLIQSFESDELEKNSICDIMLDVYSDPKCDNSTKGDALDVVVRLGTTDQREKALVLLVELGYDDTIYATEAAARIRTFYNNTQNIHISNIDKKLEEFIIKNDFENLLDYETEVKPEIMLLISKASPKKRFKCIKSLNRVERDMSKLTSKNLTLIEILSKVWEIIKSTENNNLMLAGLLDELEDMDDTCTTGHGGRFINAVNITDNDEMKITWQDQITANIAGRVQAQINKSEFSEEITAGMIAENAEDPDAVKYKEFILEYQPILYQELYSEFVGGKYIKKPEFEKYFEVGFKQWSSYIKE